MLIQQHGNTGKILPPSNSTTMKQELYSNIANALLQKRLSLNMDDCPWEEEYKQGYKEGWHNAFIYAEQIIEELLNKK